MEVPAKYKTAGTLMLVSGLMNLIGALIQFLMIFLWASLFAIGTLGIGIVCYACMCWPLVPLALGIAQLVFGSRIMGGAPAPSAKFLPIVGLVVGIVNIPLLLMMFWVAAILPVIVLVVDVFTLLQLNDDEVKNWLASQDQLSG